MFALLGRFWSEDSGQGLTEYALILALVSVGLIAIMVTFRNAIGGIFARIADVLTEAPDAGF
jgi:pilus assembly protein Flp/PilA